MRVLLSIAMLVLIFSCTNNEKQDTGETNGKPTVAVVNYPLFYFTETIGGDYVEVYLPAIPGDPAYWKPNAEHINKYQDAALILANGAGYAKWLEKVSLPSSKIVVTGKGFEDQLIEISEGVAHSHGPEGEHVHTNTAITTWLNLEFASGQAEVVFQSLVRLLPDNQAELRNNFEVLKKELDVLHSRLQNTGKSLEGETIIASHPVYQYMAEAYGLTLFDLHWEPGEMPPAHEWESFAKTVMEHQVKIMLWEDEPGQEIRAKLDEMGVGIVVFRPSGNMPEQGDFLQNLKSDIDSLEAAVD